MNSIAVLSCLSLLLAAAAAQKPKPCVSPPLMKGRFAVSTDNIMSTGSISYDALGQRIRVRGFVGVGNGGFHIDQLMLFREKVYYEINWKDMSCKKNPLDTAFIPMQVPADAMLVGPVFLGSSSSQETSVLVNNWLGNLPNNGYYMSVFTEIGCIPLASTLFTPTSGFIMVSTYDWVLGIPDPMDFSPPSLCANSKPEMTETPENMFTALKSLALKTQRGQ